MPFFGSIPFVGSLFRARSTDKVKTNLMVFIRPKILRDSVSAGIETDEKYRYMRDIQQQGRGGDGGRVALMPGTDRPLLPPFEEMQDGAPVESSGEEEIQMDVQQ